MGDARTKRSTHLTTFLMPEKGAVISDRLSLCVALESGQAVGGTEVRMPSDGTANGNFARKLTGVYFSHTHHALVDFG